MDAFWESFQKYVLPVLISWAIAEAIRLARVYAAKIKDEALRAHLEELVAAAEQMVPKTQANANDAKLAQVQAAVPKVPRENIEAAVYAVKKGAAANVAVQ
jgi:phage terminase Nu1 subunit (DNA packaging protein)